MDLLEELADEQEKEKEAIFVNSIRKERESYEKAGEHTSSYGG